MASLWSSPRAEHFIKRLVVAANSYLIPTFTDGKGIRPNLDAENKNIIRRKKNYNKVQLVDWPKFCCPGQVFGEPKAEPCPTLRGNSQSTPENPGLQEHQLPSEAPRQACSSHNQIVIWQTQTQPIYKKWDGKAPAWKDGLLGRWPVHQSAMACFQPVIRCEPLAVKFSWEGCFLCQNSNIPLWLRLVSLSYSAPWFPHSRAWAPLRGWKKEQIQS